MIVVWEGETYFYELPQLFVSRTEGRTRVDEAHTQFFVIFNRYIGKQFLFWVGSGVMEGFSIIMTENLVLEAEEELQELRVKLCHNGDGFFAEELGEVLDLCGLLVWEAVQEHPGLAELEAALVGVFHEVNALTNGSELVEHEHDFLAVELMVIGLLQIHGAGGEQLLSLGEALAVLLDTLGDAVVAFLR